MNIIQSWSQVLKPHPPVHHNDVPAAGRLFWFYVVPLALITPLMLSLVLRQHPKVFQDLLPGDRLNMVATVLFLMQVIAVPLMAWITKNLALMVGIRPSFREAFLVIAIAGTPLSVVGILYAVQNIAFNLVMHGLAAIAACYLVYLGTKNVFGLPRRGARVMLTLAVTGTAWIGYGVVLISILLLWGQVQQLQINFS